MQHTSKHRLCDTTNAKTQGQAPVPPDKRKNVGRTRNVHVQLWLSQKEADTLSRSAEKCGLTQSAYLRYLINGFAPQEKPPLDYYAMMRQLYGVANNLNQIARKAHVLHVIDAQKLDECEKLATDAIRKITEEIIAPRKIKEELFETSKSSED